MNSLMDEQPPDIDIASLVEASKKKNQCFMFCILFQHYNASVSRTLDSTSPGSVTWLLSTRNSVGGDIVTRPFVGGWVSEWVRE